MGHDVEIMSRHNLDTSSRKALAKDIAARFKVNVRIQYQDYYSDYFEQPKENTYDFITIEEIITENATKTFLLTDENYQVREYYRNHGEQLFEYKTDRKYEIKESELRYMLTNDFYQLTVDIEKEEVLNIYSDTLNLGCVCYWGRWWNFCRNFMETEYKEKDYHYLNRFRRETKDWLSIFGSNEVYYLDDQGDTGDLIFGDYKWEALKKEIENRYPTQVLLVSNFMRNPKLLPTSDYPLAFYDDFMDLE